MSIEISTVRCILIGIFRANRYDISQIILLHVHQITSDIQVENSILYNVLYIVDQEFSTEPSDCQPSSGSSHCYPGPRHNLKTVFSGVGISMLKIRQSRDSLIFNMGIPILVRRHLYIGTALIYVTLVFLIYDGGTKWRRFPYHWTFAWGTHQALVDLERASSADFLCFLSC